MCFLLKPEQKFGADPARRFREKRKKAHSFIPKNALISVVAGGASEGTRPGTPALEAHQHTFCSHLKTHFKQKFRLNYA